MSFANSFSSFPPPGTAQADDATRPPTPRPIAPEATVPAVARARLGLTGDDRALPSPIGAAAALSEQQDVRDLEIVNARLLDAIAAGDKLTYSALVDDSVTCFEPEACGHLVRGKTFHKYYFELDSSAEAEPTNSTIVEPLYRVFGDCAVVTYVRLSQRGRATTRTEETRVWQRCAPGSDAALGRWRLVHFHRSAPRNAYG